MKTQTHIESQQPRQPSTVPPEAVHHDPVWLVQRAWSEFRLPRLQQLVQTTIVDLCSLPPPGLGIDAAQADDTQRDPVAEALRACCEELRDASGMPGAEADRARHCREVRDYIVQQPMAWSDAFTEALQEYRKAAVSALESTFRKTAAA